MPSPNDYRMSPLWMARRKKSDRVKPLVEMAVVVLLAAHCSFLVIFLIWLVFGQMLPFNRDREAFCALMEREGEAGHCYAGGPAAGYMTAGHREKWISE